MRHRLSTYRSKYVRVFIESRICSDYNYIVDFASPVIIFNEFQGFEGFEVEGDTCTSCLEEGCVGHQSVEFHQGLSRVASIP